MIIELHLLQNFAPANLNRDDTGSPKECTFGGVRRARISSQAFKRAIRREFSDLLPRDQLAYRTKRVVSLMVERLVSAGKSTEEAEVVAINTLNAAGFKKIKDNKKGEPETEYLIFIGDDEVDGLVAVAQKHWDILVAAKKPEDCSAAKKDAQCALEKSSSVDLALFGRMLADLPDKNVEAACQVAHAISTNRLAAEFDYFTALDDLSGADESGAAMIESLGFNSACFYRYINIDVDAMVTRLGRERAKEALGIFLDSVSRAIPTGKQNSMAAHNPVAFWLGEVRSHGHVSLANAFLSPVSTPREGDLVSASVAALDNYWGQMTELYGDEDTKFVAVASLSERGLDKLASKRVSSFAIFKKNLIETALPGTASSEKKG